jgi:outer membrane protein TolC
LFPLIDVLNAQNALAQARTAYVQALYDAAADANALQAAVSGGPTLPSPTGGTP